MQPESPQCGPRPDGNVPAPGQTTYDITVMGTAANEQAVVSALTTSGLFASISVKLLTVGRESAGIAELSTIGTCCPTVSVWTRQAGK